MYIQFTCPQGHNLRAPVSGAGKRAKCPHCGAIVLVPQIAQREPSQAAGNTVPRSTPSQPMSTEDAIPSTSRPHAGVRPPTHAAPVANWLGSLSDGSLPMWMSVCYCVAGLGATCLLSWIVASILSVSFLLTLASFLCVLGVIALGVVVRLRVRKEIRFAQEVAKRDNIEAVVASAYQEKYRIWFSRTAGNPDDAEKLIQEVNSSMPTSYGCGLWDAFMAMFAFPCVSLAWLCITRAGTPGIAAGRWLWTPLAGIIGAAIISVKVSRIVSHGKLKSLESLRRATADYWRQCEDRWGYGREMKGAISGQLQQYEELRRLGLR